MGRDGSTEPMPLHGRTLTGRTRGRFLSGRRISKRQRTCIINTAAFRHNKSCFTQSSIWSMDRACYPVSNVKHPYFTDRPDIALNLAPVTFPFASNDTRVYLLFLYFELIPLVPSSHREQNFQGFPYKVLNKKNLYCWSPTTATLEAHQTLLPIFHFHFQSHHRTHNKKKKHHTIHLLIRTYTL